MPLKKAYADALIKISQTPFTCAAGDSLQQTLHYAREVLGCDSLWVVLYSPNSEDYITIYSISNNSSLRISESRKQAMSLISSKHSKYIGFVNKVSTSNAYSAYLAGVGIPENEENRDFLLILSGQVASMIRSDKLSEALLDSNSNANRRIEEIAALYEISRATETTHDMHRLTDMVVEKAAAVMDAQTCSLMLKDEIDNMLVIDASYGLTEDIVKGTRINIGEGISGYVAATGKPVLLDDVTRDSRFANMVKPISNVSGSMIVPLKDEVGNVIGVLNIRRQEPNPKFTKDDLKIFSVFATHASLAISNAQLYSRLLRKVQEMSTISDILKTINSTLEIEYVLTQIAHNITSVVGFDRCSVYLLDPKTHEFVCEAISGYGSEYHYLNRIKYDEGVIGLAANEKVPVFSQEAGVGQYPDSSEFLAAPIVVRDECIGVVVVDNSHTNEPIRSESVETLATFVSQAGIAVENARLYKEMQERYSELNILYEHSRHISAAYGLDNAANMLVNASCTAIKCDGAALFIIDSKKGTLQLAALDGVLSLVEDKVVQVSEESSALDFIRRQRSPMAVTGESGDIGEITLAGMLEDTRVEGCGLFLIPLVTEDSTIGALVLCRRSNETLEPGELKIISILTSHAATVLKNAMSYEHRMSQRSLELTALYEFSKEISSAERLEEALDSILAIVSELIDFDESYIYTIDKESMIAAVRAYSFRSDSYIVPSDESLDGNTVTTWCIRESKAFLSSDITNDPRFMRFEPEPGETKSLMSIPLIVRDDVIGILSVRSNSPNQYTEDQVRILSIIASQGAAIYRELSELTTLTSYTDNILSSIAAGVMTLDSLGTVLTWNSAAEYISGIKAEKIVGLRRERALRMLKLSVEDKLQLKNAIESVLETGKTYQAYKLHMHPYDRDELYLNLSISQLLDRSGETLGLVIIFEDITKEIHMENDFRRMSELASIGQLAASIAHELRNPLSSIKGSAQFLQKEFSDNEAINEFLGIIIDEVNGLNKLTTEFLDFARPMQLELVSSSINDIVQKTLKLMNHLLIENDVEVDAVFNQDLPLIQTDDKQIQQVLKNVMINALQAMPKGGRITIETGPAQNDSVYILVRDTGMGIPEDKLERIFQPFFTTKTKGTGLGLSVVNKIIENHGGKIEVSSKHGVGTTFKIILPKCTSQAFFSKEIDQTMERRTSGELKS